MFHVIDAETADLAWRRAAGWFSQSGLAVQQSSRAGSTNEVLHAAISIQNPRQRWITSRTPAMNPAFAIAEVVWILQGRRDSKFLTYFNPKLPEYQGNGPEFHGAYGYRLRRQFELDQLKRGADALAANRDTRQIVLQIWDPRCDLPAADGMPKAKDIPCNVVSLLKIRGEKLEWTQIMRSNDLFRGLPHNIVQFTAIQEVVSGWLGLETGTYNHYSDSLHLYDADGRVEDRLSPVDCPCNEDSIALPYEESEASIKSLGNFGDFLTDHSNSDSSVLGTLSNLQLPTSFINLAAIMAADALRRRNSPSAMREAVKSCSNPCLRFLFERWVTARTARGEPEADEI